MLTNKNNTNSLLYIHYSISKEFFHCIHNLLASLAPSVLNVHVSLPQTRGFPGKPLQLDYIRDITSLSQYFTFPKHKT